MFPIKLIVEIFLVMANHHWNYLGCIPRIRNSMYQFTLDQKWKVIIFHLNLGRSLLQCYRLHFSVKGSIENVLLSKDGLKISGISEVPAFGTWWVEGALNLQIAFVRVFTQKMSCHHEEAFKYKFKHERANKFMHDADQWLSSSIRSHTVAI